MTNLNMKNTTRKLLLGLVALSVALPAVPAFALPDTGWHRQGQQQDQYRHPEARGRDQWGHGRFGNDPWAHERWGHEHRGDRGDRFAFRTPYFAPRCYTQGGYWTSDGWRQVWVPFRTVCR